MQQPRARSTARLPVALAWTAGWVAARLVSPWLELDPVGKRGFPVSGGKRRSWPVENNIRRSRTASTLVEGACVILAIQISLSATIPSVNRRLLLLTRKKPSCFIITPGDLHIVLYSPANQLYEIVRTRILKPVAPITIKKAYVTSNQRYCTGFHGRYHSRSHPLSRMDRRRMGNSVLPSQGFYARLHHELGYMAGLAPEFARATVRLSA